MSPVPAHDLDTVDEHFAEIATTWTNRYARTPSFRIRLDAVASALTDIEADLALDFGGGTGVFAVLATARAHRVVLLDRSIEMTFAGLQDLPLATALASEAGLTPDATRVTRVVGDLDCLAGAAFERFDLVLAIAVLEYLPHPEAALDHLVRLLRPGGHAILTVPDPDSIVRRVERPADWLLAGVGRLIRIQRLAARSYSATRPRALGHPDRLASDQTVLMRSTPLPLGASGPRRLLRPNRLVVLRRNGSPDETGPRSQP